MVAVNGTHQHAMHACNTTIASSASAHALNFTDNGLKNSCTKQGASFNRVWPYQLCLWAGLWRNEYTLAQVIEFVELS